MLPNLVPQLPAPVEFPQDSIRRHTRRFRFDLSGDSSFFLNLPRHTGDSLPVPISKRLLPLGPCNQGPSESEDGQNDPAIGDHGLETLRGTVAFMRP